MEGLPSGVALFVVTVFALQANLVFTQDIFGGVVEEDTILDLSGSPYTVNATIIVERNASLLIEPGVELRFDPGVGMLINGALMVNGSETQRVTLTANIPLSSSSSPYSWLGIRWLPGAASVTEYVDLLPITRSQSVLRYADVTGAGALFLPGAAPSPPGLTSMPEANDDLQPGGTGPALEADDIAPVLHNVYVGGNFGSGVEWRYITNVAEITDCEISNNAGVGLSFTLISGIGKLSLDGSVVGENDGHGINAEIYPPTDDVLDLPRHTFCSSEMDLEDAFYLDHNAADFIDDPYQCLQVRKAVKRDPVV